MARLLEFWNRFSKSKLFTPLLILALIFLYNFIFTENFFLIEVRSGHLYGNLIDILKRSAPIMVIATGLTLVIATGGIDISVGSVVAISCAITAFLIGGDLVIRDGAIVSASRVPMAVALLCGVSIGGAAGVWNGMLVSRVGMQPIIATLILQVAGRGIAQMITRGQIITVYNDFFSSISNGYFLYLPNPVFIVAVVFAITAILVRKTALGLFIESVGSNRTASRFTGIKARTIIFWCYVFTGLCAGIAGILVCSNVRCADGNNAGLLMELDAILAVVIGGTSMSGGKFYLWGSMIGAIIIQTLTTSIYALGVPPEITQVVKAVVIFLICIIQSDTFRSSIASVFGGKRRLMAE
ncbi:MAG TPA: sugar ABC transporter permease [Firmicutes bacterium]|nr:sugar ABC transporter permease [Bacillota bacterium]